MNAQEAKKASKAYYNKLVADHAVEYKKMMAREKAEEDRVWADHGEALVKKIDGWIEKAAKAGKHNTYEPTDVNPHGDDVIYLEDEDRPIYHKVMDHFRAKGFEVEEYQYLGFKIEW